LVVDEFAPLLFVFITSLKLFFLISRRLLSFSMISCLQFNFMLMLYKRIRFLIR